MLSSSSHCTRGSRDVYRSLLTTITTICDNLYYLIINIHNKGPKNLSQHPGVILHIPTAIKQYIAYIINISTLKTKRIKKTLGND